jgi:anti-anti-sigma factor
MEITETTEGEVVILAPDGSLSSAAECAKLDRCLSSQLEKKRFLVVLDLLRVSHISGAAVRALLLVQRRLESSHGALVLCRLSEPVVQVLGLAGFDKDFSIVDGLRDASALALAKRAAAPETGRTSAKETASKPRQDTGLVRFAHRLVSVLGGDEADKPKRRGTGKHVSAAVIEALAARASRALDQRSPS